MGQYYGIILKNCKTEKINYNHRKVRGKDYIMAKLMEHSYMKNKVILAVAQVLKCQKCRLIWCGDYAEQEEVDNISNGEASYDKLYLGENKAKQLFNENDESVPFEKSNISLNKMFFVNHTKKEYISFEEYIKKNTNNDWCVSPISLLTAVGNGKGSGDYSGKDEDMVGTWAWDEISIENTKPLGFKKICPNFESPF